MAHVGSTPPFVCCQEQRSPVRPPEHAGEAAPVEVDRPQHLATLANTHALLVGDVPVPDGVLSIQAYAVGDAAVEVGPQPTVRQAAVGCDVERREPGGV